jgi:hypothetical protein
MNVSLIGIVLTGIVIVVIAMVGHLIWSRGISTGLNFVVPMSRATGLRIVAAIAIVTFGIAGIAQVDGEEGWPFTWLAVIIVLVGLLLVWRQSIAVGHLVIGATTIDVALIGTLRITGYVGPEAPGPGFAVTFPLDPAERAALVAHADSLDWTDTAHATTDRQFMDSMVAGAPVPTDIVGEIKAPYNAHRRDRSDLVEGRIVWRIRIIRADSAATPYPGGYHTRADTGAKRLDLPPGTSYVWVDSLVMTDRFNGVARTFIIPANPADSVRLGPQMRYSYHKTGLSQNTGYWWNRAFARWTFQHGSGWSWGDCTSHGCCEM